MACAVGRTQRSEGTPRDPRGCGVEALAYGLIKKREQLSFKSQVTHVCQPFELVLVAVAITFADVFCSPHRVSPIPKNRDVAANLWVSRKRPLDDLDLVLFGPSYLRRVLIGPESRSER